MHAAYPGEFHTLTERRKGMLTTLARAWVELRYDVEDVLDYAIRNWPEVAERAEHDHAAYKTPGKPTIEFPLRYPDAPVNLWLAANHLEIGEDGVVPKAPPKLPEPPKPPEPFVPPPTPVLELVDMRYDPPDAPFATPAELREIMSKPCLSGLRIHPPGVVFVCE